MVLGLGCLYRRVGRLVLAAPLEVPRVREVAVDDVRLRKVNFKRNRGRVIACLFDAVDLPDLVEILAFLLLLRERVHAVRGVLVALSCGAQARALCYAFTT